MYVTILNFVSSSNEGNYNKMYLDMMNFIKYKENLFTYNYSFVLDNDQEQQSPMYFNRLQYLERLFIDSSVSCTSPQQCLPRMKNDVKLHKGKAVVIPSPRIPLW
jgi:hypothetical protein